MHLHLNDAVDYVVLVCLFCWNNWICDQNLV